MDVRDQVDAFLQAALRQTTDLGAEARLVVGVSGGPDSLALLHVLTEGGVYPRERLVVGHLNHQLRVEASAEAQFVAQRCQEWQVACVVEEEDVAALALARGQSLEEAGRQARYEFLGELARRLGALAVLVAHNADDQAETVLMHFLRGSGLAGLRGMLPLGRLPGEPTIPLWRPFLEVERAEIEAYCQRHHLRPLQDSSNVDTSFFRNRLRHELLPILEDYNPRIRERLQHSATVIAADHEFLEQARAAAWEEILIDGGEDWLRVDLDGWRALPLSLRRRTLRQAVWQLRRSLRDVSFQAVEQARLLAESGEVGSQAALPGDLLLTVEYETWRLAARGKSVPVALPQLPEQVALALPVPGLVELENGWVVESSSHPDVDVDAVADNPDPWLTWLDAEVADALLLRSRREGERLEPLGMAGHSVKVSDLMINEKIPARLRARWPLVANREQLLWVVGHRLDRRARVTEESKAAVRLRCVRRRS